MAVWWCSALGTVLANEEVIDGKSERGNHPVDAPAAAQWMLRITAYADRLPRRSGGAWIGPRPTRKKMQRDWIGRSEGAEAPISSVDGDHRRSRNPRVFTTRPDTLYGRHLHGAGP